MGCAAPGGEALCLVTILRLLKLHLEVAVGLQAVSELPSELLSASFVSGLLLGKAAAVIGPRVRAAVHPDDCEYVSLDSPAVSMGSSESCAALDLPLLRCDLLLLRCDLGVRVLITDALQRAETWSRLELEGMTRPPKAFESICEAFHVM